ncbi:Rne/Rng family ribonuclease [Puerhibacterium sp. TATVAM-FAB25]|uniref:Rne/Rng family ribonuclease n=1 Tax=Puerhibacterium sp. TATVAM-FAB25 TaxID=3093699 RepID=UPI0039795BEF
MTSDSTTGPQNDSTGAPARRSRRRVVRPAGGPVAEPTPAAPEDLGITLPAREPAPAQPADEAPAAPARRSRRVTRPASTPEPGAGLSLDDIVLPERPTPPAAEPRTQVTAGRSTGRGARRAVRSLDDIVLPGGDAAEPATAPAEPAPAEPAPAEAAPEPAPAKAPRSRRRKVDVAVEVAADAATQPAVEEPAAAAPAEETPAAEAAEPAPKKRATRSRRRKADEPTPEQAAEVAAQAEAAAAQDAPAVLEQHQESPSSPAATAPGSATPRLATTALLFQAPDLSAAARRPRRAQAPAGPPRFHDVEQAAPSAPEAPADAADATAAPAQPAETPEAAPAAGRRSRRAIRATRAAAPAEAPAPAEAARPAAEAAAEATAAPSATAPGPVLSEDEVAAAEEVAAIEAELLADGVELVDLRPEDLVEDDRDADADAEADAEADADADERPRRRRRRGGRGRRGGRRGDEAADREGEELEDEAEDAEEVPGEDEEEAAEQVSEQVSEQGAEPDEAAPGEPEDEQEGGASRRRRRRRRGSRAERLERAETTTRTRERDEVTALKGSTRLEAKRQRRREGRDAGRRRQIITEAEFLARRESVKRSMIVREKAGRTQIAVLEDGVLVEHYVSQQSQSSMVGNVYLGRVQNVLPSMEAAFVDVGKGRNAVLYAGEVNWDAAGLEGQPRRIEQALKSGDTVLVQVTKDPIGHKGARLTSQITLAGRYLVFVPGGGMTGISRKLPDVERGRLKKILREIVPDGAGVIVRTAAEGASAEELRADVERLQAQWSAISAKAEKGASAPALLQGEPDLAIRVVRDIFNDDFTSLVVQGDDAWREVSSYVEELAPDLRERVTKWTETTDAFATHRVDEQLAKGMDRKVWLPSGGSLVIDRTEAMTVIDVNTGKFTGEGGTLEETVTRNNLEAAEEIVRQLRLRDIGGIIVIDFIDMVLESNRDLVLRRLVECLGRDRTKHQVAEVTSLGLVQMTRKRVGQGLVEAFSETCEHCKGRGFVVHTDPVEKGQHNHAHEGGGEAEGAKRSRRKRGTAKEPEPAHAEVPKLPDDRSEAREAVKARLATIAAAAAHAHEHKDEVAGTVVEETVQEAVQQTVVVAGREEVVEPVADAEPVADVEPVADAEPAED